MAETNGLLNRRTGHSVPGVRIPLSPRYKVLGLFSGCSTVGSMPGLGPGGRQFESGHPDDKNSSLLIERLAGFFVAPIFPINVKLDLIHS